MVSTTSRRPVSGRLGDYTIRVFATPVTVCLDVAPVITCIVTVAWLESLANQSGGGAPGPEIVFVVLRNCTAFPMTDRDRDELRAIALVGLASMALAVLLSMLATALR